MGAKDETTGVETKAMLIEPPAMTLRWMNEAAAHDAVDPRSAIGKPVLEAIPMPEALGVGAALAEVAETGEPRHLHASLVSTVRGTLAVVVSVHRLPDGMLLLLNDTAWAADHTRSRPDAGRRPGRGR